MRLFSLTSSLHGEMAPKASSEPFIKEIEKALGESFTDCGDDFGTYGEPGDIIYVRTGGTEGMFKEVFDGRPARLLTSGQSNSLAASMEILSYLRQTGIQGEILHGSAEEIAAALRNPLPPSGKSHLRGIDFGPVLEGKRYGVVGKPSDWLISSDVDYSRAREVLGAGLIDIPMTELLEYIRKAPSATPPGLKPLNAPKYGRPIGEADLARASSIYWALREIVGKYALDGLTLRCFDLLTSVGSTGCLALALLNSEGTVATCEGDVPAMLTMAVGKEKFGVPGFQVNLSRINAGKMLFAHCTVPLSVVSDYCFDTHFESGTGVAIHGEFPAPARAVLFKIGAGLRQYFSEEVLLEANCYGDNLCRTQVIIDAPGLRDYMLREPLGNHHVIFASRP